MQVISLGTHVICPTILKPVAVMEVMPTLLAKRAFPPLDTAQQLVPGYRDSPEPGSEMAIAYIKVCFLGLAACKCKILLRQWARQGFHGMSVTDCRHVHPIHMLDFS